MFSNTYVSLLEELSSALGCGRLVPDERNSCLIHFPSGIEVQIEVDRQGLNLMMLTEIGSLSPGKYREEVLYEGLRANDQPQPRYGNFGYNPIKNQLVLWELLPLNNLRGTDIASILLPFLKKAEECRKAIDSNMLPVISISGTRNTSLTGLFGFR